MLFKNEKLGNKNVPENTEVIGTDSRFSGEINYTYYFLDQILYEVGDWSGDKPRQIIASKEVNALLYKAYKDFKEKGNEGKED